MKILVIYYSFEGNTAFIAKIIQEKLGAELLALKPVNEIKTRGFMKFFWGGKQVMMKEKPPLKQYDIDLKEYDLIFLGTPVWSFTFSPPLRTFFSNEVIKDQKIALFCTHDGGMKKTLENMEKELIGNEIIGKKGFINVLKNKEKSKQLVIDWLENLQQNGR